jgi:hypothetical protein
MSGVPRPLPTARGHAPRSAGWAPVVTGADRLSAGGVQMGLLGRLRVTIEGEVVPLGAAKERAVLGVLALRWGRAAAIRS